jgi:hypothetical protein
VEFSKEAVEYYKINILREPFFSGLIRSEYVQSKSAGNLTNCSNVVYSVTVPVVLVLINRSSGIKIRQALYI